MKWNSVILFSGIGTAVFLGACTQPAPLPAAKAAPMPVHEPNVSVNAIRAAGAKLESAVEVKPLRDPAVDGLIKQAHDLEAQGQPAQALDAVRKAEKIAANAPDIIQYEAELQIETGDWKGAAASAQKSYDAGPKLGALCARNQQTLVETRGQVGDTAGVAAAKQQLAACAVAAPPRY